LAGRFGSGKVTEKANGSHFGCPCRKAAESPDLAELRNKVLKKELKVP
jgi:hypothetical protein